MIQAIVAWYRARGWAPVRVPPLKKSPVDKAWPSIDYSPEAFAGGDNIGIKLGDPSGGLVDIDLDCPEAIALAPLILPPTWTFGRAGELKTAAKVPGLASGFARHYLYLCPGIKTKKPAGTHTEMRSTGSQTIVPGSTHESGYAISWADTSLPEPTVLEPTVLERAFAALSIATVLARAWPELAGNRHDTALAMAGALWHSGWPLDLAQLTLLSAMSLDGTHADHRGQAIADTWETERQRYGWPAAERLLGRNDAKICQRLATDEALGFAAEIPDPTGDGLPLNESGNADRLLRRMGDDLRFVNGIGWYRWTGSQWDLFPGGPWSEMEIVAKDIAQLAASKPGAEGKAIREWSRASGNSSRIRGALEVASTRETVLVAPDDLDANPWILNVANGIVDLKTGQLLPHERGELCTKQIDIAYDPHAQAPRFMAFLAECMNRNMPLVAYLLRFLGYSLTGDVSEHVINIWHGPEGANGKSTLINTITRVMGPYAGITAPEVLLKSGVSAHPTGLMDFRGRRLVGANEAPEAKSWNEALVKQLTGGDTIKARAMRQDFVEFRPTWKIILAANTRPLVREQGGAFWRRVHSIPWVVSFRGREDKGLERALHAEAAGILSTLVKGCIAWQTYGLAPPPIVLESVNEYRASQDTVGAFLTDVIDRSNPSAFALGTEVYSAYRLWANGGGENVLPRMAFFRVLHERGIRFEKVHGKDGVRGWKINGAAF